MNLTFPVFWNLLFHHPRNHFIITQQLYPSMLKSRSWQTVVHVPNSAHWLFWEMGVLLEHSHTHSLIASVAAFTPEAAFRSWDRDEMPHTYNLKYLLSGPLHNKFANPWPRGWWDSEIKHLLHHPLVLFFFFNDCVKYCITF